MGEVISFFLAAAAARAGRCRGASASARDERSGEADGAAHLPHAANDAEPVRRWTEDETAELNRLARAVVGGGDPRGRAAPVEVESGLSDAGDPWFVVSAPRTGEVLVHVARIEGRFVLHRMADDLLEEAHDLRTLVRRSFRQEAEATVSNLPTATLVLVLIADALASWEAQAAESALPRVARTPSQPTDQTATETDWDAAHLDGVAPWRPDLAASGDALLAGGEGETSLAVHLSRGAAAATTLGDIIPAGSTSSQGTAGLHGTASGSLGGAGGPGASLHAVASPAGPDVVGVGIPAVGASAASPNVTLSRSAFQGISTSGADERSGEDDDGVCGQTAQVPPSGRAPEPVAMAAQAGGAATDAGLSRPPDASGASPAVLSLPSSPGGYAPSASEASASAGGIAPLAAASARSAVPASDWAAVGDPQQVASPHVPSPPVWAWPTPGTLTPGAPALDASPPPTLGPPIHPEPPTAPPETLAAVPRPDPPPLSSPRELSSPTTLPVLVDREPLAVTFSDAAEPDTGTGRLSGRDAAPEPATATDADGRDATQEQTTLPAREGIGPDLTASGLGPEDTVGPRPRDGLVSGARESDPVGSTSRERDPDAVGGPSTLDDVVATTTAPSPGATEPTGGRAALDSPLPLDGSDLGPLTEAAVPTSFVPFAMAETTATDEEAVDLAFLPSLQTAWVSPAVLAGVTPPLGSVDSAWALL